MLRRNYFKRELVVLSVFVFVISSFLVGTWAGINRQTISFGPHPRNPAVDSGQVVWVEKLQGTCPLTGEGTDIYMHVIGTNETHRINYPPLDPYKINDYPQILGNLIAWKHTDLNLNKTNLAVYKLHNGTVLYEDIVFDEPGRRVDKVLGILSSQPETVLLKSSSDFSEDAIHIYDLGNQTFVSRPIRNREYLGMGWFADMGMDPAPVQIDYFTKGYIFKGQYDQGLNQTREGLFLLTYGANDYQGNTTNITLMDELSNAGEKYVAVDYSQNKYCAVKEMQLYNQTAMSLGYGDIYNPISAMIEFGSNIIAKIHNNKIAYVNRGLDNATERVTLFDTKKGAKKVLEAYTNQTTPLFEDIDISRSYVGNAVRNEVVLQRRESPAQSKIDLITETISRPAAPTDLLATKNNNTKKVNLNWADNSNNEDGFEIWRKIDNKAYFQIATVGPNTTTYVDDIPSTVLRSEVTSSSKLYYRIRAYNEAGVSAFSNEASPCFIATAAYGSALAEEVNTLRAFRDQHLMKNAAGREFVELYYELSPPLAGFIADKPVLRAAVRFLLRPVVWLSEKLTN